MANPELRRRAEALQSQKARQVAVELPKYVVLGLAVVALVYMAIGSLSAQAQEAYNNRVATVVVKNTRIWTGNTEAPYAEALACCDLKQRLLAVGSNAEAEAFVGEQTQVIDGAGKGWLVTPGFVDSHVHLLLASHRLHEVDLRHVRTPPEFQRVLRTWVLQHRAWLNESGDHWILGGSFNPESWGGELPTRTWIDPVTMDSPAFLCQMDGHTCLANTRALQVAGVTRDTVEPDGGVIVRDEQGHPTGLLRDNAIQLVSNHLPAHSMKSNQRALARGTRYLHENGVTSVHHMALDIAADDDFDVFNHAREEGTLRVRIYYAMPITEWPKLLQVKSERPELLDDDWFKIGNLKGFMDGSFGSRSALMKEAYEDGPANNHGLRIITKADMTQLALDADRRGLHLSIHALGDQAVSDLLDIAARVRARNGPRDRRMRIEHAQAVSESDVQRMAQEQIIASMQPSHMLDDGRWLHRSIGNRIARQFVHRDLLDAGVRLAFGSDWFVAEPVPMQSIHAAANRLVQAEQQSSSSDESARPPIHFVPRQAISVEEALKAHTVDAAYAAFDDHKKGSLRPGFLGDFVILDRDILTVDPETVDRTHVLMTVVGGEIVHEHALMDTVRE